MENEERRIRKAEERKEEEERERRNDETFSVMVSTHLSPIDYKLAIHDK